MRFTKKSTEILDYGFDLNRPNARGETWLDGDTISTSTWAATGDDSALTVNSPVATHDTTTTTVWLGGGTGGHSYLVANTIVTVAGRRKVSTFEVDIVASD